jgi:uncharacterized protein (TIGR00251 family)
MPFHLHDKGVVAQIRLTPGARKNALGGTLPPAEGKTALKAAVTDPPENGKANKELLKMLAKTWGLPKTSLRIIAGETARRKAVLIETGNAPALLEKLRGWLAQQDA